MIELTKHQEELKEKLEHGDVTDLAKALGVTTKTIQNVIYRRRKGQYVWDALEKYLADRSSKRAERILAIHS